MHIASILYFPLNRSISLYFSFTSFQLLIENFRSKSTCISNKYPDVVITYLWYESAPCCSGGEAVFQGGDCLSFYREKNDYDELCEETESDKDEYKGEWPCEDSELYPDDYEGLYDDREWYPDDYDGPYEWDEDEIKELFDDIAWDEDEEQFK